jgi:hypothetical protein
MGESIKHVFRVIPFPTEKKPGRIAVKPKGPIVEMYEVLQVHATVTRENVSTRMGISSGA